MTTPQTLWKNAHVLMQDDTIELKEGKKSLLLTLHNIRKIYLRPRKINSIKAFIHTILAFDNNNYTLCVTTQDAREYKFRVKSYEKQIYVNMISQVRLSLRRGVSPLQY